jgi:hypothetical protein
LKFWHCAPHRSQISILFARGFIFHLLCHCSPLSGDHMLPKWSSSGVTRYLFIHEEEQLGSLWSSETGKFSFTSDCCHCSPLSDVFRLLPQHDVLTLFFFLKEWRDRASQLRKKDEVIRDWRVSCHQIAVVIAGHSWESPSIFTIFTS